MNNIGFNITGCSFVLVKIFKQLPKEEIFLPYKILINASNCAYNVEHELKIKYGVMNINQFFLHGFSLYVDVKAFDITIDSRTKKR